nr:SUMF1/EgtB/PvdO family nonheme iron enzyme [Planctomycetota bacterium]
MLEKKSCCTPSAERDTVLPPAQVEVTESRCTSRDRMTSLEGGTFRMGSRSKEAWEEDGEGPVREISIRPFWIDQFAVTNAEFAEFVESTGFSTESEYYGWSFVFHLHLAKKQREELRKTRGVAGLEWWLAVPDASWQSPFGPGSTLE